MNALAKRLMQEAKVDMPIFLDLQHWFDLLTINGNFQQASRAKHGD